MLRRLLPLAVAALLAVTTMFAADPPIPPPTPASAASAEKLPNLTPAAPIDSATPPEIPAADEAAGTNNEVSTNVLLLNFRGVSLDTVLDYLSDAAGFIIVKEARVKGTVELFSKQPEPLVAVGHDSCHGSISVASSVRQRPHPTDTVVPAILSDDDLHETRIG